MNRMCKMLLFSAMLLSSRQAQTMDHGAAGSSGDEKKKALCPIARAAGNGTAGNSAEAGCPICSDSLSSGGEVADSEGLPFACHHPNYRYHDACMARWVKECKENSLQITCPICRAGLRKMTPLVQTALAENPPAPAPRAPIFDAEHLVMAARYNEKEQLLTCLAHGVDVNAFEEGGSNALDWAAINGSAAITRVLLDQPGINVNARYEDRPCYPLALFYAVKHGHKAVAQMLLNHPGIDARIFDLNGLSILEYTQDAELQNLLIAHGARENLLDK